MSVLSGRTAIERLVLLQSWTVTIKNNSGCNQLIFFKKCFDLFYVS